MLRGKSESCKELPNLDEWINEWPEHTQTRLFRLLHPSLEAIYSWQRTRQNNNIFYWIICTPNWMSVIIGSEETFVCYAIHSKGVKNVLMLRLPREKKIECQVYFGRQRNYYLRTIFRSSIFRHFRKYYVNRTLHITQIFPFERASDEFIKRCFGKRSNQAMPFQWNQMTSILLILLFCSAIVRFASVSFISALEATEWISIVPIKTARSGSILHLISLIQ